MAQAPNFNGRAFGRMAAGEESAVKDAYEVVVVGAGFAGLACGARLRQRGVTDLAIVEQGDDVGAFWRGNYDRIRLHSPFHDLPDDGGARRRWGVFLHRDELLTYFEGYARRHRLYDVLNTGTFVERVRRGADRWELDTSRGPLSAQFLVIATAYNRNPLVPDFPGADVYQGRLLHSRGYRNATPFQGARALVVGSGNSAAEIALDLSEGGAASIALLVRAPRHVLSAARMGVAARIARLLRIELTPKHFAKGHTYTRVHPEFHDKLREKDAFFSKFSIDLSEFGIQRPEEGPATQMYLRGRVAWADQGTAKAIRRGKIRVIDGNRRVLEGFTEKGVRFSDGEEAFDTVVLGTGFEPGLDDFMEDAERLLYWNEDMARRMPLTDGRSRSLEEPSLFFPGFDLSVNGGISLGLWGFEVADVIANERAA